jgi:hypothetical protein
VTFDSQIGFPSLTTRLSMELPIVRVDEQAYVGWEDRLTGSSSIYVLEGEFAAGPVLARLTASVPDLFLDRDASRFGSGTLASRYASLERIAADRAFDEAKRVGAYDALSREVLTIAARGRCAESLLVDAVHALAGVPFVTDGSLDDLMISGTRGSMRTITSQDRGSYGFERSFELRDQRLDRVAPGVLVERWYAVLEDPQSLGRVRSRTRSY